MKKKTMPKGIAKPKKAMAPMKTARAERMPAMGKPMAAPKGMPFGMKRGGRARGC